MKPALVEPWPPLSMAGRHPVSSQAVPRGGARKTLRTIAGISEDAAILLLGVLLFPVAILVVGTPVALFARLLLEVTQRWLP